jgi:hypothetical protein
MTVSEFTRSVACGAASTGCSGGMCLRCIGRMLIAHDTLVQVDGFAFSTGLDASRFSASLDGLTIIDDIVSCTGSARGRSTTSALTFSRWTGFQRHGTTATPRFFAPDAHDYRLRANSAAIDAGIVVAGVSTSFLGGAPDLGRFERRSCDIAVGLRRRRRAGRCRPAPAADPGP